LVSTKFAYNNYLIINNIMGPTVLSMSYGRTVPVFYLITILESMKYK